MNLENILSSGTPWRVAKKLALCVVLAGVGLAVVYGAWRTVRSGEPLVDFSGRPGAASRPAIGPVADDNRLRFAVATMVSAETTFATYQRLVQRICRDVGRQEAFIVPPSYADVRVALEQGKVDVALVCTGTYVHSLPKKSIRLLVQPEFEEPLEYRCLIIAPARSNAKTLEDLRGAVMAFTDPESNTGHIVPRATLVGRGLRPESFFREILHTGSHDNSILAVSLSFVDAAAVDALIWESMVREDPSLAERVKIIWRSEVFGPPPIVVPTSGDAALARLLQEALLALDKDEEGRAILSAIGIRRFVRPRPEDYRSAVELYRKSEQQGGAPWP